MIGFILLVLGIFVVVWMLWNWPLIFHILDNLGKKALHVTHAVLYYSDDGVVRE